MEWQNDAEAQEASKCGSLRVERAGGLSAATRVYGTYPVKLMVTEKVAPPGTDCVWVYGVTFGGGLVSGDRAGVSIQVAATCACVLATQAATKVYKQRAADRPDQGIIHGGGAVQACKAEVGDGALLVVLPDPVMCFRDAKFRQVQHFSLETGGSLVAVDWLTAGRVGYGDGERWVFESYESRLVVAVGGSTALVDAIRLTASPAVSLEDQMGAVHASGTVVLIGPRAKQAIQHAQRHIRQLSATAMNHEGASWVHRTPGKLNSKRSSLLASASPFSISRGSGSCGSDQQAGLVVRFAAESSDGAYGFLREILSPLSSQLGAPPYQERGDS